MHDGRTYPSQRDYGFTAQTRKLAALWATTTGGGDIYYRHSCNQANMQAKRQEAPPAPQLTIAACAPGMRETSIKVRREACTRRVAKCENGVGASRPLHAAGRPFFFIATVVGVVCEMCWRAEKRGRGVLWRARVGYRCRIVETSGLRAHGVQAARAHAAKADHPRAPA